MAVSDAAHRTEQRAQVSRNVSTNTQNFTLLEYTMNGVQARSQQRYKNTKKKYRIAETRTVHRDRSPNRINCTNLNRCLGRYHCLGNSLRNSQQKCTIQKQMFWHIWQEMQLTEKLKESQALNKLLFTKKTKKNNQSLCFLWKSLKALKKRWTVSLLPFQLPSRVRVGFGGERGCPDEIPLCSPITKSGTQPSYSSQRNVPQSLVPCKPPLTLPLFQTSIFHSTTIVIILMIMIFISLWSPLSSQMMSRHNHQTKNRLFLGKSPKQRTPPTHRYSLGLT